MKLAIIAPRSTKLSSLGDFEFVLAQNVTVEDESYYKRLSYEGREIMLDHGAFELGHPAMSDRDFLNLAERIEAKIVIAPDVQWNPSETLRRSIAFADMFRDGSYDNKMKLMSVIWSAGPGNFGEWFQMHMDEVNPDIYGIGKWYESMYASGSREQLIKGLMQNFDVKSEMFHALGCPYAHEVFRLRNLVRSMDTGLAVKAAVQIMPVYLEGNAHKRLDPVALRDLNVSETSIAKSNAEFLLSLAQCS